MVEFSLNPYKVNENIAALTKTVNIKINSKTSSHKPILAAD